MSAAGFLILIALSLQAGGPRADEHLLAGANAFREGDHARALVEFRVAQKLGAPGADGYVAASLLKLGRAEEAVEAFSSIPVGRDPLLDYYRALALYEVRLYGAADRILAGIGERAGPRIAAQLKKIRADIAAALAPGPEAVTIDWYLDRCVRAHAGRRPALAVAYCQEAAAMSARRPDGYRQADARSALAEPPAHPVKP